MHKPLPEAQELLDFADLAYGSGDFREGSRLVWEAARISIAAVAAHHGWPCDSMDEIKQVIYRLDGVDQNGKCPGYPMHFVKFTVADMFREHAETNEWEYPEFQWSVYEFKTGYKSVKKFTALLAEYVASESKL